MPRRKADDDEIVYPVTPPADLRSCDKCGGTTVFGPRYHASQLTCPRTSRFRAVARKEHLHLECACGYDWIEPVNGDTARGLVAT